MSNGKILLRKKKGEKPTIIRSEPLKQYQLLEDPISLKFYILNVLNLVLYNFSLKRFIAVIYRDLLYCKIYIIITSCLQQYLITNAHISSTQQINSSNFKKKSNSSISWTTLLYFKKIYLETLVDEDLYSCYNQNS